jgi:type II secretory pathway predicted ATPase ExeA
MRQHYVKTSNHQRFMDAVATIDNRGSKEACILRLTGAPGTGKTTTVDHWAAKSNAVLIDGVPGMGITFVRDYLADQTGIKEPRRFAQDKAFVDYFKRSGFPIILDEAQHGLPNKAECIEYLRRIGERAGVILVLVAHSSEAHRFGEERLAHIATRISAAPELKPASIEDVSAYLEELCEVQVDAAIAQQVHEQSRGRYRLMANAGRMLEAVAGKKGAQALTATDVKGLRLCEDVLNRVKK